MPKGQTFQNCLGDGAWHYGPDSVVLGDVFVILLLHLMCAALRLYADWSNGLVTKARWEGAGLLTKC